MAKPKTVYYADTEALRPVPTTIEPRGDKDEDGRDVQSSTHFKTEREAWERLVTLFTLRVKSSSREVDRLRSAAAEAEHELVTDAHGFAAVHDGFKRWEREQERQS